MYDELRKRGASVPGALQQAVQLHQQGRLIDAEHLYREVLRASPRDFDALHMLGVLKLQQGRPADALPLLSQAVEARPSSPDALSNLSVALLALQRPAEALVNLDKLLALQPGDATTLFNRGTILARLGRHEEALASLDLALAIRPDHVNALFNRATILASLGRYAEALAAYDRVLAFVPHHVDALNNRGSVLAKLDRFTEALASYERVLAIKPDHAKALSNHGGALRQLRRYEEALISLDRALSIEPRHIDALSNRGNVLMDLNRPIEALQCYDAALSLVQGDAEVLTNRALALHALGSYAEALQSAEDALAVQPLHANAFLIRGHALAKLDRPREAALSYERTLSLDPNHRFAFGASVMAHLSACDFDRIKTLLPEIEEQIRVGNATIPPFSLLGLPLSSSTQLQCARNFVRQQLRSAPQPVGAWSCPRSDKIKLAYISGDFRRHPVGYGIVDLLERHDRARFEVVGVSYGADDGSETRARAARAFDQFHDVRENGDRDVAKLLLDLQVDIAVDLAGHTENSRAGILAYRPAPVQVNYFGFPGSTGAEYIDYVIADRTVLPLDQQPFYTEQIVHLPDSYQVNDATRPIASPLPTRHELGLPADAVVFCCFNNSWKINATMLDVWGRLLCAVPDSVLWLYRLNGDAEVNVRQALAARGVDPLRLALAPYREPAEHLARLTQADLFLDTLPYNAHTTASDALWAGVPLVTCLGSTFAGRVAASLLDAVGLPELVTGSLDEYEALARKLATDPELLKSYRTRLERNRLSYPLFDTGRLARHLEAAYATMLELWQRGEPPRSFSVEAIER